MTDRPFLLVVAGPNGSGKTTLIRHLQALGIDFGTYINADDIAATLQGQPEPGRSLQAQKLADFQRDTCLSRLLSFSFETVMSHPSKVELMIRAHDAGYDVTLFFVATSNAEINVGRVENRVVLGGHDVPHDRIRARYQRSLAYLPHAALVARRTVVFDNSALLDVERAAMPDARSGLRPVAEVVRTDNASYTITIEALVPSWVRTHLLDPLLQVERNSEGAVRLKVVQANGPLH